MSETKNEPQSKLENFEQDIYRDIPLSLHLGVKVAEANMDHVRFLAPLEPNRNHQGMAFGGSVHAVAVLSCWALMTQALKSLAVEIEYVVVQDTNIKYLRPITADFEAHASWSNPDAKAKFFETLSRKGLGRVEVQSDVYCNGTLCAHLSGRFVAKPV
jgi:thioesterase domain-containing protein